VSVVYGPLTNQQLTMASPLWPPKTLTNPVLLASSYCMKGGLACAVVLYCIQESKSWKCSKFFIVKTFFMFWTWSDLSFSWNLFKLANFCVIWTNNEQRTNRHCFLWRRAAHCLKRFKIFERQQAAIPAVNQMPNCILQCQGHYAGVA
jgi:hypothetical protein